MFTTKHVDIRVNFCGDAVNAGTLSVHHSPSTDNLTDILQNPPSTKVQVLHVSLVFDISFLLQAGKTATSTMLATFEKFRIKAHISESEI